MPMPTTTGGAVYSDQGEFQRAISDFTKAIELQSDFAKAYYNRGEAWLHLGKWDRAKSDLNVAVAKGVNINVAFQILYKDVLSFERKNGMKLPEDIVEMLSTEVTDMRGEEVQTTAHLVEPDVEVAIKRIKKKYERAWKTLAKL